MKYATLEEMAQRRDAAEARVQAALDMAPGNEKADALFEALDELLTAHDAYMKGLRVFLAEGSTVLQ